MKKNPALSREGSVTFKDTVTSFQDFCRPTQAREAFGHLELNLRTSTFSKHAGVHGGTREGPQEPGWGSEKMGGVINI